MDNEYGEAIALAALTKYPKNFRRVKEDWFEREGFKNLYKLLNELAQKHDTITMLMVYDKVKGDWGKYGFCEFELNKVFEFTEKLRNKSESDIDNELGSFYGIVNDNLLKRNMISNLYQAIEYIREDRFEDAMFVIRNYKLNSKINPISSQEALFYDFYDTNGFRTGIKVIDESYGGFLRGNVMQLAGDTGSMKTKSSLWLCIQFLRANPDFTCLYFEKEMPVKDLARNLTCWISRMENTEIIKSAIDFRENKDEAKFNNIKNVIEKRLELEPEIKSILDRLKIVPSSTFHTANDMVKCIDKYKPQVWALDFFTMLTEEEKGGKNVEELSIATKDNMSKLKDITEYNECFGIIVNQIVKNSVRARNNKIADMQDSYYGGTLNYLSAYIYTTFYPWYYYEKVVYKTKPQLKNYFYLINCKSRHGIMKNVCINVDPGKFMFEEAFDLNKEKLETYLEDYITENGRSSGNR